MLNFEEKKKELFLFAVPKNFHRLARDMCNADYLEDFCQILVEPTTPPPQVQIYY